MPSLAVKLTADTAEFQADMGKAGHIAEREMERMVSRAAAAGTIIGSALTAMAGRFRTLAEEAGKAGAEVAKFAERSGFAVRAAAELRGAVEIEGESWQQVTRHVGNFNKTLAEAQNEGSKAGQLFRALGVDINAGPEKAFEQFAKSIKSLDVETKASAMRVAFGQGADALIPFMNKLDEARERAKRLGIVLGDDLVADSKRFEDAMTTISASSRALAVTALTPASAALATIAENLVTAKERGTQFKDIGAEIGKVFLAAHGTILSYVPVWGEMLERAAQRGFNALERMRQSAPVVEGGAVSGVRSIGGQLVGPPDPPDKQARAACAVSGGKWVNGACEYQKSRTGRTPRDQSMSAEQMARAQAQADEEEARTMSEAMSFVPKMQENMQRWQTLINAWGEDTFMGMSLEDAEAWVKNAFEGIDAMRGIEEQSMRMAAGFTADGQAISDSTKKTTDEMVEFWRAAAEQMQHAMSGLFFDVMQGNLNKLGDRFKQAIDKMVANALAAQANVFLFGSDVAKGNIGGLVGQGLEWFKGLGGGGGGVGASGFGEAAALVAAPGGGFVPALAGGTPFVKREGLAYLHPGERVLTERENRAYGRGGMTVNVNVSGPISRGSADQIAAATGRAVQRAIDRNT